MFLSKYWADIHRYMLDEMHLQWQFHHIYGCRVYLKHTMIYAEKLE